MNKYDVIVIGTGAGNIVLEKALEKGLKCAQIEKGKFGGTCLTRGCIPTKVMITAADLTRDIEGASHIGVEVDKPHINWERLTERLWSKIDESKDLLEFYLNEENLDVYQGTASFKDNKTIEIKLNDGGHAEIEGEKIFINVGGRTKIPQFEGLEEAGYITSETLFGEKYPNAPYKSLIVLGGGPIGSEFAHAFNTFGAEVHLIQHNVRMLPKEDEEISEKIRVAMEAQGINLYLNKDTIEAGVKDGIKFVKYKDRTTGEEGIVYGEEILVAPGIRSNADLLKLENTDIRIDKRGYIITNEFLETSAENVWALGDINGKQQFRHKANYEGYILAHNLFDNADNVDNWRWAEYDLCPAVTFTYPQVAHVGLTEKDARDRGYDVMVARNYYSLTAKGYALGYEEDSPTDGLVKLIGDAKDGTILGAHVIGHEASVLIQPYLNLMNAGERRVIPLEEDISSPEAKLLRDKKHIRVLEPSKIETVRETMVPHPTLSEVVIWAADNFKK